MNKLPIKNSNTEKYHGYQMPTAKQLIILMLVVGSLIAFSWLAYYKLGWFH